MSHALVITASLIVLVSCKSSPKEEPKDTSTSESKGHSSSWVPTDAALVAGQKIYEIECSLCHDEGEEGAPRLSSKKQWTKREAKGLETLISNAIKGFDGPDGEMPPRGGTKSLTDEEVANAVKYMIAAPK